MVEDIINIHINVINNLYNIINIKCIINQIIKTMSKQLFKVSNLPKFLFRDKMGVIINSSQGYPQVFNHIIIPSDSNSTEIIKVEAIRHIREHHVFIDKIYETSPTSTATVQAAVKRAFVEPVKEIEVEKKKSMFDDLNDTERRIISQYFGPRVLEPEEQEKGVYEND